MQVPGTEHSCSSGRHRCSSTGSIEWCSYLWYVLLLQFHPLRVCKWNETKSLLAPHQGCPCHCSTYILQETNQSILALRHRGRLVSEWWLILFNAYPVCNKYQQELCIVLSCLIRDTWKYDANSARTLCRYLYIRLLRQSSHSLFGGDGIRWPKKSLPVQGG